MNNGNGSNGKASSNPAVIAKQREVAAAEKPLREQEKRASTTRHRLAECEQVLTQAEQDYDRAQDAFVDDDTPANRQKLKQTHDDVAAARSRVEGFRRKLAAEEAAVLPLRTAYDMALVALAEAHVEANLAHLEEEWSVARQAVNEVEMRLVEARQVAAEAERRYKTLAAQRREADQRRTLHEAHIRFRQANPQAVGFERVRTGF